MTGIPTGFHSLTPYIVASDANAAIKHYQSALGAKLVMKLEQPGGHKIMHACLQIGSSKLFLCDDCEQKPAPKNGVGGASFILYVEDVDAAHKHAVEAGMVETLPPTDMFWGDRMGGLTDKFGHHWNIATNVRDVSPEEMAEAMKNADYQ